ncbi:MAG TPA: trehalose-phosphatase [Longimicrobiales bacterium]|nr:trehalose-phosphatase [Longimicrobiales bacterium]
MLADARDLTGRLREDRARHGILLLGLDFDGTLAPIVPRPEDAALPAETRALLEALADRPDTHVALISGRGLADLRGRVGLAGVFYAGNHGLEIEGPGVHRVHPEAVAATGRLAETAGRLRERFGAVPGVIVEDKGLTLSVHYRLVEDPAEGAGIARQVRALCEAVPDLRVTDGKKVVEIRPDVEWHKGRALSFLSASLLEGHANAPVVFIGDDRTDEDAFRVVGDGGCAVVVGDPPADTAAHAALASTTEVRRFLECLA